MFARGLDDLPPLKVDIGGEIKDLPKVRHEAFDRVLALANRSIGDRRLNVWIMGPSGTGKTFMARKIAEVMGRKFAAVSCSAGMGESAIFGRFLPIGSGGQWEFLKAEIAQAYGEGGLILFDEIDAADSNLLVAINPALANGSMFIPGYGEVKRHPDTVIICAANTYGTGPDAMYVGREQLDAATLDRFVCGIVPVDYDPAIEKSLALGIAGNEEDAKQVCEWVWKVRAKVAEAGIRRVVSTRMIENMALALRSGDSWQTARRCALAGWRSPELQRLGTALAPKPATPRDWATVAFGEV